MKRDMLVNTTLWDQFLGTPPHSAKCRNFRLSIQTEALANLAMVLVLSVVRLRVQYICFYFISGSGTAAFVGNFKAVKRYNHITTKW